MCIHEQLETLHDTMSYENVQNVNVFKNYLAVFTLLCSSSKQDPKRKRKKESILRSSLSKLNTSVYLFCFGIYNTIDVTAPIQLSLPGDRAATPAGWGGVGVQSAITEWLHLNPLNSLLDVFQQGFVFWALVLVLVCVHIC